MYHFDYFQDCVAAGQKAPSQPKTLVFLIRPTDGARPALVEPKPPGVQDEVPMSFWQKVRFIHSIADVYRIGIFSFPF
jgi:hypothetical protein